jgi:choline dehydrogenase
MNAAVTDSDYLVIGAGSAGAAAAYRLARAGRSVTLVEAGPTAAGRANIDGLTTWATLLMSEVDWGYLTTPQPGTTGRQHLWSRGKVLGGTSSINGIVWMRGALWDFDGWAATAGSKSWSAAEVTKAFREFEDFPGGDRACRGTGGPMRIRTTVDLNPVTEAFFEACEQRGFKPVGDFNGAGGEGFGPHQLNAVDGVRQSSYRAFIEPIESLPAVRVVTDTLIHRLELDASGSRVTAVHAQRDGKVERWVVDGEVIVSAGSIESPKLLMLSGLGAASELRALGIEVQQNLPGVGKNLHDHLAASVSFRSRREVPAPKNTGLEGALFTKSDPGLEHYDLQYSFIHFPTDPPNGFIAGDGFTFFGGSLPSDSRGTLTLTSADPTAHPLLDPRYLAEQSDVDRLAAAVEIARELAAAPAFDPWRGEELAPGPSVSTKDGVRDYVRRTAGTFFHPVGTCKLGVESDDQAVVGADLRVYGVENLRVADASVMPDIVSANPNAAATMIGWRAGGFAL